MNLFFLIAKIVTVAFFLIMFLRSDKVVWGVGLLTVTSAILLDTFLGTFGREEMIQQLGFFFYILAGALFAGATFWLWGVLRPYAKSKPNDHLQDDSPEPVGSTPIEIVSSTEPAEHNSEEVEYPALSENIRDRFSSDQIADLAFDMGYFSELESASRQDNHELLLLIVDKAANEDRIEELNLAVDRIDTPIPPEHLPRIEKLQPNSPPTVLRQYVVGNYTSPELKQFAIDLGFDWTSLEDETLHTQARGLLLFAEIRGRKGDLIDHLRELSQDSSPEEPETSSS
jgi:hypothetical protein